MVVDLEIVRNQFDRVHSGEASRAEVSDWARKTREQIDSKLLELQSGSHRDRIWKALIFLESYDMRTSPSEYLYAEDDLLENRP